MLQKKEVKDPRIDFVTITRVKLSNDLKNAEIFITHYGDEGKKKKSLEGLNSACGFIQGQVGRRLGLRFAPQIQFSYDEKLEKVTRVLEKLDSLSE